MPQVSCNTIRKPRDGTYTDADGMLVNRLRAGDESAFTELVKEWSPMMLGVARKFVASRESAEDVVQDTWLGILSGLAEFQGRSMLRTWMLAILVNRARSRGAREARTVSWSPRDFEDGPAVDPADSYPEGAALSGEVRCLVAHALSELPPRQRSVVSMRDIRGQSAGDVCAALGISPQNQRVLLHRGRAVLRAALAGYYRG